MTDTLPPPSQTTPHTPRKAPDDTRFGRRIALGMMPTPLQPLDRFSQALGGTVRIWAKRDDCTGLALGGNKVRKLEFAVAQALDEGCDTLITVGAMQSNHARQTAAAASVLGLACHLVLQDRSSTADPLYMANGNALLDSLLGATLHVRGADADMLIEAEALAETLTRQGRKPFVIPAGASTPVGALGYAAAAAELMEQADSLGLSPAAIVQPTGSGGTQAGMIAGLGLLDRKLPVLGISVSRDSATTEALVHDIAVKTAALLKTAPPPRSAVVVDDSQIGPGYAAPTDAMKEALHLAARTEGLLLDPVYTGKGMAGLIAAVRAGRCATGSDVIFLHTGGAPALFAYPRSL